MFVKLKREAGYRESGPISLGRCWRPVTRQSSLCVPCLFIRRTGGFFLVFSATSAGMFVSAPALLPSSSSMILFMLVMAFWLNGSFDLAVRERRRLSAPLLTKHYVK